MNTSAIDKIIASLAMQDYLRANPRKADGRPKYKRYHPYTLSMETNDARQIKIDYVSGAINEEEYKAWCLKWNLSHADGR